MSKRLTRLIYNPSSLHSFSNANATNQRDSEQANTCAEKALEILDDLLLNQQHEKKIFEKLIIFKRYLIDTPATVDRFILMQEFNLTLQYLRNHHGYSFEIFNCCVQVAKMFKDSLDEKIQEQKELIKCEWIEIERLIFELTQWDELLQPHESAIH